MPRVFLLVLALSWPGVSRADRPSLGALIESARARALVTIQARGEAAAARAAGAGARVSPVLNPYLEIQMDHGPNTHDVQVNSFVAVPIELNPQRRARIRENDALVKWREAGQRQAEAEVVAEVVTTYGALLSAESRIALARRAEDDARAEAEGIAERMRVGDATIFDRSISDAEVVRWRQTRADGSLRRTAAATTLSELTGVPGLDEHEVRAEIPLPATVPDEQHLVDAALTEAPMLRVLTDEERYHAASGGRWSAERFLPLSFIVNGGRGDTGAWRAGGGVAYTFPITRRYQGEIAKERAEEKRVSDVVARLREVLSARTTGAAHALRIALDAAADQAKAGIPTAQQVVDAAFATYRAGKGELLRVFIARRDLQVARGRRLDFVEEAWRAYGKLVALGAVRP
ncbi:MAG: TolC family protein [Polyangia bacterium]